MKSEVFRDISRRYAALAGRRDNVIVEFRSGGKAWTDGRLIVVPELPYGTVLSELQVLVFGGYLDHEASHVRYTDFDDFATNEPRAKKLINLIEDVRCELIQINKYPGIRVFLDALCNEVDNRSQELIEAGQAHRNKIISAIYKECWEVYRGVKTPIPFGLHDLGLDGIADLLTEIPHLESTKDSKTLALKIVRALEDIQEQMKQPAPPQMPSMSMQGDGASENPETDEQEESPESEQSGGEGSGDGDSEQSDEQEEGESEGGEGSGLSDGEALPGDEGAGQPSSKPSSSQGAQETKDRPESAPEEKLSEGDVQEALDDLADPGSDDERQKALQELMQDAAEGGVDQGSQLTPEQLAESKKWRTKSIYPPADPSRDELMVRPPSSSRNYVPTVQQDTAKLVRELIRVMQSRDYRAWTRDREEGELDDDALYSVAVGNKRVYQVKRERRSLNTAVELMVDESGSMNDKVVSDTTAILSMALNSVPKLKFEICGFRSDDDDAPGGHFGGHKAAVGRLPKMQIEVLKSFNETVGNSKKYLAGVTTKGWTPLGDAYAIGMENLVRRKEPRKILWMVTDGTPEFTVGDARHSDYKLMYKLAGMCEKFGIITVGLVIGHVGVDMAPFFKHFEHTGGQSLVDAMLKLARKLV